MDSIVCPQAHHGHTPTPRTGIRKDAPLSIGTRLRRCRRSFPIIEQPISNPEHVLWQESLKRRVKLSAQEFRDEVQQLGQLTAGGRRIEGRNIVDDLVAPVSKVSDQLSLRGSQGHAQVGEPLWKCSKSDCATLGPRSSIDVFQNKPRIHLSQLLFQDKFGSGDSMDDRETELVVTYVAE